MLAIARRSASKGNLAKVERSDTNVHVTGHWMLRTLKPGESVDSVTGVSPE